VGSPETWRSPTVPEAGSTSPVAIAPRILDYLINSEFRRRFEQKGRFCTYLEAIPSQVIIHPAATFLGLMSGGI
jgi:hypothetical protein